MSEKLLIVGGTGFIGNALAHAAVASGLFVTILSLNKPLVEIDGVKYIQANVSDVCQLKSHLKCSSFEFVVNLSGYVDHRDFLLGGREIIDVHFNGVGNILEAIDWSVLKRFVQIGSSDEYGNIKAPQTEGVRELPISPYSLAKLSSTHLLEMLYRVHKLPVVIFRLFLVYGPAQKENRFLPQIINGCLRREKILATSGMQIRDFCYIDDVIRGIMLSFTNNNINGEVINLAAGEPLTVRSMVEKVRDEIGHGEIKFGGREYRRGENMELYANIAKANELLGWRPLVAIEEGLINTISYYKHSDYGE